MPKDIADLRLRVIPLRLRTLSNPSTSGGWRSAFAARGLGSKLDASEDLREALVVRSITMAII
jgi:hypothetical protein